MYKFRLLPIPLFAAIGLLVPLTTANAFLTTSTSTTSTQAALLPVLSSQDFITAVDSQSSQTQSALDAALATLLGVSQSSSSSTSVNTTSANVSQPTPAESSPTTNPKPAATTAPTSSGFNPYAN